MKKSFPKRAFLPLCLALSLALLGGCSYSASSTSETILNTISHIDAVGASKLKSVPGAKMFRAGYAF